MQNIKRAISIFLSYFIILSLLTDAVNAEVNLKREEDKYHFSVGAMYSVDFLGDSYIIHGASLNAGLYTESSFFLGMEIFLYYNFTVPPVVYFCPGYYKRLNDLELRTCLKVGILTSSPDYFDLGVDFGFSYFLEQKESSAISLFIGISITCLGVGTDEPFISIKTGLGIAVHF